MNNILGHPIFVATLSSVESFILQALELLEEMKVKNCEANAFCSSVGERKPIRDANARPWEIHKKGRLPSLGGKHGVWGGERKENGVPLDFHEISRFFFLILHLLLPATPESILGSVFEASRHGGFHSLKGKGTNFRPICAECDWTIDLHLLQIYCKRRSNIP